MGKTSSSSKDRGIKIKFYLLTSNRSLKSNIVEMTVFKTFEVRQQRTVILKDKKQMK